MFTGIRIGELCALQWKDIDFKKRILTVRKTIQRIQVKKSKIENHACYNRTQKLQLFSGNTDS